MKTAIIRQKFLDYFAKHGHIIEPSSSLIPQNDKSLLFVNAGMVPFKNVFSGAEKRSYTRAVSAQRCIRAGGKHNDLENVGYTARHHTFFEMLGNFSFGDYFKKEAIKFAWDFLTVELKLSAKKLWVSVYENDNEAESIWINDIGFPKSRISRCGKKDNFWQMGDAGPCGPCSEVFYDHGPKIAGGPPGTAEEDGDRFIEIWNLVFTQFDRQADGYLKPLANPGVDTGMGLERIAAVMQNKHNNYDIDLFVGIINHLVRLSGADKTNASVRVIADHIRSCSFLIADGVLPSNEGRGYVLRRIIRRAVRHGHKLGIKDVFFYRLAPILSFEMSLAYPELKQQLAHIENVLKKEEKRFLTTLDQGLDILNNAIANLTDKTLSAELIFKLYDTYGFPPDLTADIAKERGLILDMVGFDTQMAQQKKRAKQMSHFSEDQGINVDVSSDFLGYDQQQNSGTIKAIIIDGKTSAKLKPSQRASIVLDVSVFYAEAGGQIGDSGYLISTESIFKVVDTQKQTTSAILHIGTLEKGSLKLGDKVSAIIDKNRRKNIARNHSATHLLHASLREVLGENVSQKGSLVDADKLRFDFAYDDVVGSDDLVKIESMVNHKILDNTAVHTDIMDLKTARKKGAIALFGQKYDDQVRVLSMGKNDFSVELCGGTHVGFLGDIGLFRIISESGIATGIRRIEALTGLNAYQFDNQSQKRLGIVSALLKTSPDKVEAQLVQLLNSKKQLSKQLEQLQSKLASVKGANLAKKAQKIGDINLLCASVDKISNKDLRIMVDELKNQLNPAVIALASVVDKHIVLVVGVSSDISKQYSADEILRYIAIQIDGKGGGRADMAQGGGSNISQLPSALSSVKEHFF